MERPTDKQIEERKARLAKGQCPIHGKEMEPISGAVGSWQRDYLPCPLHCEWHNCNVIARGSYGSEAYPATLEMPWAYLIDEGEPPADDALLESVYRKAIEAGKAIDRNMLAIPDDAIVTNLEDLFAAAEGNYRLRPRLRPMSVKSKKNR